MAHHIDQLYIKVGKVSVKCYVVIDHITYSAKRWRGKTGESGAIRQSFTHPNLRSYIIKLRVDSMTNEYKQLANMHENYKLYS